MKIAVIAHAHFPIKRPYAGGLEAHTHQLVNELINQGHDVTLFAKAGSSTDAKLVTIFRGNPYGGDNPFYDRGYTYAMKRIARGQFDLIFNNSLNHVPLRQHSEIMAPMVTIFHTPPFPKMIHALEGHLSVSNRTYIAVSEFTARQWRTYCPNQVQVVANGIDLSTWVSRQSPTESVRAAWVGRITPEKGTHLALQVCIGMNLPITFGGYVADKKYFNKEIKPLLRNHLVTYKGHVNSEEVNKIYRDATVAVITPLWDEPFGLVAIEALASGTPVAAFARGGLTSIITPAVGVLAENDSVEALQSAIIAAMDKRRDVCARYAMNNFTLPTMVQEYLQLIDSSSEQDVKSFAWAPMS